MALTGDFVTGQPVPFARARKLLFDQGGGIQEGVVNANDFMVIQRVAGANMSVDIGAGFAWVQIDTGTNNGLAHVTSDATGNVAVTAAHATLPRIDQLILRYNDTALPTGAGNIPTLEILTGTATSGATTTNRLGAAALPNDCCRLADILVPAASSSVVNTNIRDRRLWARGAQLSILRSAGNYSTASTSLGLVDSVNLQPRLELSGVPLTITLFTLGSNNTAAASWSFDIADGGIAQGLLTTVGGSGYPAGLQLPNAYKWDFSLAPGSHLLGPMYKVNSGTGTIAAVAGSPLIFAIAENVRQTTANNTTTSG